MFLKHRVAILRWLMGLLQRVLQRWEILAAKPYRAPDFAGTPLDWFIVSMGILGFVLMAITGKHLVQAFWEMYVQPPMEEQIAPKPMVHRQAVDWPTSRDFRKAHRILNIGSPVVGDTLDPTQLKYYTQFMVLHGVYRTLVTANDVGDIKSGVALRWFHTNGGRTITFELDPDAHFRDGTRITADDVAWSISRIFWPSLRGAQQEYLGEVLEGADNVKDGEIISGIEVINPIKFRIKLKQPCPTFMLQFANPVMGILPKDRYDGRAPLSSGPVQAYYNPIEKAWSFSRDMKNFNELDFTNFSLNYIRLIPTSKKNSTLKVDILNGNFDLIFGLTHEAFKSMELPEEYIFKGLPANGIAHFYYNMKRPFFSDRNFRADLSWAVQTIADTYKDPTGNHIRINTYVIPTLMPSSYYKNKMKKMRLEDFKKKWKEKIPKKIEILTHENGLENSFMEKLSNAFKEIGINIIWKKIPDALVFHNEIKKRNYDILYARYVGHTSEIDQLLEPLHPKQILTYTNADTTNFFKKINEFRALSDWKERIFAYQEAIEDFEREHYLIPLFHIQVPVVIHKDFLLGDLKTYDYNYENVSFWKMKWR